MLITYKQTFNFNNINNHQFCSVHTKNINTNELNHSEKIHLEYVIKAIELAYKILKPFEETPKEQLYYAFRIPKHSGGLRTINAPMEHFKTALSEVKHLFESHINCLPHNAAYAYIKQRSTIQAIQQHKNNESNWFLKIDLKDFFPSCTPTLIYSQLLKLYPFACCPEKTQNLLYKIIDICCLNNGLPQGTPMSPILTNLLMVSYDFDIQNYLINKDNFFIYTRYADDILISSKIKFKWSEIVDDLKHILQPFIIHSEKVRFGSKSGRNWNLGLMLNKDNNITLGFKEKRNLNAMLNNFLQDFKENNPWSKDDTYYLQGKISYLNQIEPDYASYIINKYNQKHNLNYYKVLKTILK